MHRSYVILVPLLAALLGSCTDDPARYELPSPKSWKVLIPESRSPLTIRTFPDGTVVAVGSKGLATRIIDGAWSNDLPVTTSDLVALWGTHPDTCWAVGDDGAIAMKLGNDWTAEQSPTGTGIADISGVSSAEVYAVAPSGRFLVRRFGTWSIRHAGILADLVAVACVGPDSVVFVADDGRLGTWNGSAFSYPATTPSGSAVDLVLHDGDAWVLDGTSKVHRWTGDGWESHDTGIHAVDLASMPSGIMVGGDGFAAYADGAWTIEDLPAGTSSMALTSGPAGTFVLLHDGSVVHDPGIWTEAAPPSVRRIRDIAGAAHDDWYACGDGGLLVHWDGVALHHSEVPDDLRIHALGTAADSVFAVGDRGLAMVCVDGSWTVTPTGVQANLLDVRGRHGREVYAVGEGGAVVEWDGGNWSVLPGPPAESDLVGVAAVALTGVATVERDGVLWRSSNGPISWVEIENWGPAPEESSPILGLTHVTEGLLIYTDHVVWPVNPGGGLWDFVHIILPEILRVEMDWDGKNHVVMTNNGDHGMISVTGSSFLTVPGPVNSAVPTSIASFGLTRFAIGTARGGLHLYDR